MSIRGPTFKLFVTVPLSHGLLKGKMALSPESHHSLQQFFLNPANVMKS